MKHLGDITKLSGYVVPAVDVVIGGSPCQGLSVAGKQAGLKDERSGLFIEQIRLVKEMRKADAARGKQMTLFDQDTWSGKMSPEPSALTKAETLRRFSKKPSASLNRKPPQEAGKLAYARRRKGAHAPALPEMQERVCTVLARTANDQRVQEVRRENPAGRAGTVRVHLPGLQESELRPDEHRGCRNHKPEILLRLRPEHTEAHMGPGQALLYDVRRAG